MRVANAPCSWGILEFDPSRQALDYPQVLGEMRETGYEGTELGDWGFLPTDPRELSRELRARNLELVGAFVPVAFSDGDRHSTGEALALKTARLLADVAGEAPLVILSDDNNQVEHRRVRAGRIGPGDGLTDSQWSTFAQGVTRIAQSVRAASGLRSAFHHHCGGFVETSAEVDRLLGLTDPGTVGLCLDTGHYRFGGGDPTEAVRKYENRIWHVHFKDCEPSLASHSRAEGWDYVESIRRGIFCELGKGEVDFPALLKELEARRYEGWIVVEQDVLPGMGSPRESAWRNRAYLREMGL